MLSLYSLGDKGSVLLSRHALARHVASVLPARKEKKKSVIWGTTSWACEMTAGYQF